ncbi:hypothetical protein AMECASPLE_036856 [Ameca splendens]|uniref:Uncharacterized protein n=1 Tax=Ameca splendens TaxID=208324 RepID=A0ABV0YWG3_9TELE
MVGGGVEGVLAAQLEYFPGREKMMGQIHVILKGLTLLSDLENLRITQEKQDYCFVADTLHIFIHCHQSDTLTTHEQQTLVQRGSSLSHHSVKFNSKEYNSIP